MRIVGLTGDVNFPDVANIHVSAEALTKLIADLSREAIDDIVGAGFLVVFPERIHHQRQAKKDKDKALRDNLHSLLWQIQQHINQLQGQIDELSRNIARLDNAIARSTRALIRLRAGELPDGDEQGRFKDEDLERDFQAWEQQHGQVGRNNSDALRVAIAAMQAAQKQTRHEYAERRKNLEQERDNLTQRYDALSGNTLAQQAVIAGAATDNIAQDVKTKAQDDFWKDKHDNLYSRLDEGENVDDIAASVNIKDDLLDDVLFLSATDKALNKNFTHATHDPIAETSNERAQERSTDKSSNNPTPGQG